MQKFVRVLALILPFVVQLGGVEIKTAYTRYYEAGEIRSIPQYFGANLLGQRFRTIVASNPDQPSGQYFITRIDSSSNDLPVSARMSLYSTASKELSEWTWDLEDIRLDNWVYLGLTGEDWPDKEVLPLAWRIELLDSAGTTLAEWKSFLWEME